MHPIMSNNAVVNAVIGEYPNIRQWMVSGISQMPTDTTKYHTVQHVETMLKVLDEEYKNPANQKFFQEEITILGLAEVLVAIFWHDVVYIPGHPNNESESAAKWELYARQAGDVPLHFVHDVSDMINSTKIGFDITWIQDHPAVALLHDLDYISFASYAVMVMNRSSLRNEFASISDKDYTEGRLKFLMQSTRTQRTRSSSGRRSLFWDWLKFSLRSAGMMSCISLDIRTTSWSQ